jgi:hypothetical protein
MRAACEDEFGRVGGTFCTSVDVDTNSEGVRGVEDSMGDVKPNRTEESRRPRVSLWKGRVKETMVHLAATQEEREPRRDRLFQRELVAGGDIGD